MPTTLDDILRVICDFSNGFKTALYIADESEVTAIPAAVDGVVTTAITMAAGKKFYKFDVSKESGDTKLNATAEGTKSKVYNVELEAVIVGVEGAKSAIISGLKNCYYIVIVEDLDGRKWIVGEKDNGVDFLPAMVHDGTLNEYQLKGACKSKVLPLQYTGAIPTT